MKYFFLQTKRVWKAFPSILFTTLILAGILCILAYLQTTSSSQDQERQKITLGLVGDTADSSVGIGVALMQEMDSSRFTCTLVEMSESQAEKALAREEIQGYLVIPENFIESVMYGENKKVTFVTGTAQHNIGTLLARELADAVSTLLTETQSGIYAFQHFLSEQGVTEDTDDMIYEMNLRYFSYILPRTDLYQIDTPDSGNFISVQGYFFCGAMLLFFLFLGITGCHLFIRGDLSLNRLLAVQGQKTVSQILSEYAAYCILLLLNYLVIIVVLTGLMSGTRFSLPELSGAPITAVWKIFLPFALLIPVTGAITFFLCQITRHLVSGVLLTFCCVLCLGYLSGCFYPLSFFPEGIQRTAQILPTGILMEYLQRVLTGEHVGYLPLLLFGWILLFLVLSCLIRKRRLSS